MKSLKKITALIIALVLTVSVLGVFGASAAETVPTYSWEDIVFEPTMEMETKPDVNIEDAIGGVIEGVMDNEAGEVIKDGVEIGTDFTDFFSRVMKALVDLFDFIFGWIYN